MLAWFMRRARALRTWLFVRLRIWRGRWRRGRITVPGLRLLHGLGHRTWRYGLYAPGGLSDEVSAPLIVVLHGCKQRALSFAYAAGWTDFADSVPASEYEETVNKSAALGRAIDLAESAFG